MSFPVKKMWFSWTYLAHPKETNNIFMVPPPSQIRNMTLLYLLFITLILNLPSFWALTVKNCEGSEMLPYWQANKSAYHIFMDAGGKHKTLVSKIKSTLLLTEITVARISAILHWFPKFRFSQYDIERPIWHLYTIMCYSTGEQH